MKAYRLIPMALGVAALASRNLELSRPPTPKSTG